jgi:hypothetical protein
MNVHLDVPLRVGDRDLEPGDYEVVVDEDRQRISLRRDGVERAAGPAIARAAKMQVQEPRSQLRQVQGEPRRLLVARTPPANEWVLSLDEVSAT